MQIQPSSVSLLNFMHFNIYSAVNVKFHVNQKNILPNPNAMFQFARLLQCNANLTIQLHCKIYSHSLAA